MVVHAIGNTSNGKWASRCRIGSGWSICRSVRRGSESSADDEGDSCRRSRSDEGRIGFGRWLGKGPICDGTVTSSPFRSRKSDLHCSEPVVFNKFPQAIIGPEDAVVVPHAAHEVDYEAELVVVIGKRGKRICKQSAMQYVAGYTVGNDVSARDWQKGRPGGQWLLGKTPDTFAPTGPYLVTADEVDPTNLKIGLRLNGVTMQASTTREWIFSIEELIVHVSTLVTLHPGDLLFTGTPPGVGAARKPPVFIKPGDRMEVEIEDVGILSNPVVAEMD